VSVDPPGASGRQSPAASRGETEPVLVREDPGFRVLRALLVERVNGKGHDVEIVRTEPRDVAPVIPLPVRMHGNRVIEPLDVPAGTVLREDPGPLARALMAASEARTR
jgi:hypothetical protein